MPPTLNANRRPQIISSLAYFFIRPKMKTGWAANAGHPVSKCEAEKGDLRGQAAAVVAVRGRASDMT